MRFYFSLAGVFGLYFISRFWPLFKFGHAGFGYDTGIYRRLIEDHLAAFADPSTPSFAFASFSSVLRVAGVSLDQVLIGWYILLAFFLAIIFFVAVKEYTNQNTAFIAVFLFVCSLVQYEFYTWFYYRQLLAIMLFLAATVFLRRQSWLALMPLVALGSIHPISYIPVGVALIVYGLVVKTERRYAWSIAGVSLIIIVLLNASEFAKYVPLVSHSVFSSGALFPEFTGQFLSFSVWLRMSIFILPLGLLGLGWFWKKQKFFTIFFLTSAVLYASQILFYRRFLVDVDMSLIFFAAMAVSDIQMKLRRDWTQPVFIFLFFGIFILYFGNFVIAQKPIISPAELAQIRSLDHLVPEGGFVLALTPREAPWLFGYTHRPVIAPGMLEWNKWDKSEWQLFWSAKTPGDRAMLLSKYNHQPIYIYISARQTSFGQTLAGDPAFMRLEPFLWRFSPAS